MKKKSISFLNKFIDSLHLTRDLDVFLHFVNEALIHKNPKLFIVNLLRYGLNARARRSLKAS